MVQVAAHDRCVLVQRIIHKSLHISLPVISASLFLFSAPSLSLSRSFSLSLFLSLSVIVIVFIAAYGENYWR